MGIASKGKKKNRMVAILLSFIPGLAKWYLDCPTRGAFVFFSMVVGPTIMSLLQGNENPGAIVSLLMFGLSISMVIGAVFHVKDTWHLTTSIHNDDPDDDGFGCDFAGWQSGDHELAVEVASIAFYLNIAIVSLIGLGLLFIVYAVITGKVPTESSEESPTPAGQSRTRRDGNG